MEPRYLRNVPSISHEEQALLKQKKVIVLGCGGLGGYLIEALLRMGIGSITAVDGDVFEESNLNRQLLSTTENLGRNKALSAAEHAALVNPGIEFHAVTEFLSETNAQSLISGQDLVLDALDNIPSRLIVEDTCRTLGIPIIHGAVNGWMLQAAVVMPASGLLHTLYAEACEPAEKSTLPMSAQLCAAIQCAEAIKLLCGREVSLKNKLLMGDLLCGQWESAAF